MGLPAVSALGPRSYLVESSALLSPAWLSPPGLEPQLGPLAAAYVLILAVLGPLVARGAEPLARLTERRPATT